MGQDAGTRSPPSDGGARRGSTSQQRGGSPEKKNSVTSARSDADDLRLAESDYGIDLSAGSICHACGARNNGGQSACWQCRATLIMALDAGLHTLPASRSSSARPAASARLVERILIVAALLTVLTALGLTAWLLHRALNPDLTPATTLGQVFERNLVTTRVLLGVIMIVCWPAILHGAAKLLKLRFQRPTRHLTLLAILMGGLTYVLSVLPGSAAVAAVLIPLVLAPLLFQNALRLAWRQTVRLWLAQMVALAVVMAVSLWGIESLATRSVLNPMQELPVIFRQAQRPAVEPQQVLPAPHGRSFPPLRWASSGSRWLDGRANQAQIVAINPGREKEWGISLQVSGETHPIDRARHADNPWRSIHFTPKSDVAYLISIDSEVLPGDLLQVYSLLPLARP